MSNIWNLRNPLRCGLVEHLKHGTEFFGTVISAGKMQKTVKVRVDYRFWNSKYRLYMSRSSTHMAHDEENYCSPGDKIVIRRCKKISNQKNYYVREVIKAFPKDIYYKLPNPEWKEIMLGIKGDEQIKKDAVEKILKKMSDSKSPSKSPSRSSSKDKKSRPNSKETSPEKELKARRESKASKEENAAKEKKLKDPKTSSVEKGEIKQKQAARSKRSKSNDQDDSD